jgi:hypothetical protein
MEFGDVAVVIKDLKEFIERIKTASIKKEMGLFQAPVEYIDKKVHQGKMGPFRKFSEYEYQSEFRFVLDSEVQMSKEFIKLPIGDIRDITMVCPSDKLSELPNKVQRY